MPHQPLSEVAHGLPPLPEDERTLLLLGLLTAQDRHGYEINDFIEHNLQNVIALKKATAYQLLERLEHHGLVESRIEQHGHRPSRKVYHLTDAGRERFGAMLLTQLRQEEALILTGNVPVMFSENLNREDLLASLQERLDKLEARVNLYDSFRLPCTPGVGLAMRRIHHLTRADRDWLSATLQELRAQTEETEPATP
ncbi:PadR family transcriptional regulator [Deinococcus cavernae]|uniref:PadR family transcriptional regulator n=1 Tax=Deinococcus cavernae TaxID=2320857 RepID=A0A418V062_9DEIO|nr:PadR family transcriptional regulator [Deinococcus cavernae]RJF69098.1 PadR family transcriptional regulator [Deinococcus cavernae]